MLTYFQSFRYKKLHADFSYVSEGTAHIDARESFDEGQQNGLETGDQKPDQDQLRSRVLSKSKTTGDDTDTDRYKKKCRSNLLNSLLSTYFEYAKDDQHGRDDVEVSCQTPDNNNAREDYN